MEVEFTQIEGTIVRGVYSYAVAVSAYKNFKIELSHIIGLDLKHGDKVEITIKGNARIAVVTKLD